MEELKEQVCRANLRLAAEGLVMQTWGNVSGVDRDGGFVVIKPSGVPYDEMKPEHMVVVSLETGEVAEGDLRPSSDTPTHRVLYRALAGVGGVVHAHSLYATAWAQSRREIPCLGTTHADFCFGPIPCTRQLKPEEIAEDYEANTGKVIAERFASLDLKHTPAVLVAEHGPFAWGAGPDEAVTAAVTLEQVARLASETLRIDPSPRPIPRELQEKHFLRKHGPDAYYGQT
ncbi:MAG: L-ribulose-5-phosphate 4-epimerase AraD [Phycisphaerae bacterium]|nr:L-ribulose-5-phosphate 4-epimerase AraD [Phycisphaerae bacterium]